MNREGFRFFDLACFDLPFFETHQSQFRFRKRAVSPQ